MPKIIIREYDNTKASSTAYNNFAVLVPGFCGPSGNPSVFKNGVYECHSQADFEKNIGKAAATTIAVSWAEGPTASDSPSVTAENFEELRDSGTLYYRVNKEADDTTVGYLKGKRYKYKQVPYGQQGDDFKTEFEEGISGYAIIEKGKEGVDEADVSQMGNQIAYELLGLGYPVLFKNINTQDVDELGSDKF